MHSAWADKRMVVVGGHSRSVGKTALMVDLIRAFPEVGWTAVKVTQYGHNICSASGKPCGCAPRDQCIALDEEHDRSSRTDTSRLLVAGAARVFWLRVCEGCLADAMPLLRGTLRRALNVIIESNSLLDFVTPDRYLMVLDPSRLDFKPSARRLLDRADALVLRSPLSGANWPGVPASLLEQKRCFLQPLGQPLPPSLLEFCAPPRRRGCRDSAEEAVACSTQPLRPRLCD